MRWFFFFLLLITSNQLNALKPAFNFSKTPPVYDSVLNIIKQDTISYENKSSLLDSLGRHYHTKENYKEAIRYTLQSLTLHKKENNKARVAHYNARIGVMFYYIGDYDFAIKHLLEALAYSTKNDLPILTAEIEANIANVYTRLDQYDQAINYLLSAKKHFEKTKDDEPNLLAGIYINIGLAYEKSEKLDSANYFYNAALSLVENKNLHLYEASIFNNKGEIYFKKKDYDRALINYQKAYSQFEMVTNENGMGTALLNKGRVFLKKYDYELAIKYFQKSLVHFKKIESLRNIVEVERLMSNAYKGIGQYKLATEHLETYIVYNDSLKGNKIQEHITNLELQSMALEEQQKYELYKKNAEIKQNKLQLEKVYLYITIIGVIVLLVIVILILLNMKKNLQHNKLESRLLEEEKSRMKNDLIFKQREIENFANHIQEKNNLLKKLSTEIKTISKQTDSNINNLKRLKDIVNHSIYVDENRKELELKIDHAHQQFIQRLKSKFPQLTKTEIRLCSLLLLKFSSKEIAAIMSIEPSSVKMGRNRLRKKLNLPPRSDISKFLSEI
ncbi:hypothetical protein CW751_11695 [Brumimicrobium salinarum]|uniref:HTH luxR-type domain-containing protein n=1 Tax=Brumimicrobium salinarum TaxID=2058658 RepID=A0A2I0R0R0_9FLAO|nr:tetratricopeptide repeat protein [Brumimicrobium salinarum]PKR80157.1 hypothetical protein CW751_11695 [Brumimicrobium salinarum]